jgi:hypothetical protein
LKPLKALRWAVAAATVALAATACGGLSGGTALNNNVNQQSGLAPLRPGTQIGILGTLLYNDSRAPVIIDAIKLAGQGLGTVIRPVETQIAAGNPSVPQSVYAENPPVTDTTGGCVSQVLRPVTGYRLRPGDSIAIWTIILAVRPGRYDISTHLITYTIDGSTYQESITQGFHGTITRDAPVLTTAGDGSDGCRRHSHLLPGVPW